MSYLIALYVYYHGNNINLFGITRGAKEEELNNSGLKRPYEIDPELVDNKLIQDAMKQDQKEKFTKQELDWDAMMKDAIKKSQQKTYELYHNGGLKNTVFENSPDVMIDDDMDDGQVDMSIFDSLNGITPGNRNGGYPF